MYTATSYINQKAGITVNYTDDYSELLKDLEVGFTPIDYYLKVGTNTKTQGWVLHISVIISQIKDLLEIVIPKLVDKNISFKIPSTKETARGILHGNMGETKIGKVISIYPADDIQAIQIAKEMIILTKDIKGPQIPTDVYLGGSVYARYGSINPIILKNQSGEKETYIYNDKGELTKDEYLVPFELPAYISWPFSDITTSIAPISRPILKNIYKPTSVLKLNVRGNVLKGIYVKKWLLPAPCIIKQGIQYMISEEDGRDIKDRLEWQYKTHKSLERKVLIPKVIDLFQEGGDTYLIMEYINGISFFDKIKEINYNSKSWLQLSSKEKHTLLAYLQKIITAVSLLHENGYIHRDIAPGNFMIDKKDRIFLIDVELAYSMRLKYPNPPFELGTEGYMSPEQKAVEEPKITQDIYSIGALILTVFTGLSPVKFDTGDTRKLIERIFFFIGDREIASLIAACLNKNPLERPGLSSISQILENYNKEKIAAKKEQPALKEVSDIQNSIQSAINGLTSTCLAYSNELWYSKPEVAGEIESAHLKEYSRFSGLYKGITGVLYLIAEARRLQFNIDNCFKSYIKGWDYIESTHFRTMTKMDPGLYAGAAGIALSLAKGIDTGLLENSLSNRNIIANALSISNNDLTLANGVSGRGIAALECSAYLNKELRDYLLTDCINKLLNSQQKDGSWITSESGKLHKSFSLATGTPGVICFLLQYLSLHRDETIKLAVIQALTWLSNQTLNLKKFNDSAFTSAIIRDGREFNDERLGCILAFLKAHEVLKDNLYRKISEDALMEYPDYLVNNNFTIGTGIAGLGEVYLQAFTAFNANQWYKRSSWIANTFINTQLSAGGNVGYWNMDDSGKPTADLMIGSGGVIHFLLKYYEIVRKKDF